jgi:hypothetical protein
MLTAEAQIAQKEFSVHRPMSRTQGSEEGEQDLHTAQCSEEFPSRTVPEAISLEVPWRQGPVPPLSSPCDLFGISRIS